MTRGSASMAVAHLVCGMWLAHAAVVSAQHRAWPAAALMATAALVAATAAIREALAARPVVVVALPAEDRAALAVDDGLAQLYDACCDDGFTTRGARHRSTCTGRNAA
ncbi:hypothetical protein ACFUAH_17040 [Streptomyces albidoflavus]|uniref:hypothetical protein n=1 Tax=Streptomyces albidoflavus TaxID=1886 RepID=UPI000743A922|nr:hypothetical protein [Streptomyces albidoflavus]KUL59648.1 hypothetical protein ADL32_18940 [Streptomyces albidoflavus]